MEADGGIDGDGVGGGCDSVLLTVMVLMVMVVLVVMVLVLL